MLAVSKVFVCLLSFWFADCENLIPGHMQPLGSHMPPLEVEVLRTFPDPLLFHSEYVQKNWPVKLKGLLKDTDVLKNWQSDEYLRRKFGEEIVGIDDCKKENRTERSRLELKMSEFLDRYQTEDLYMVSDMPKNMADEWPLPSFLLCGGYTDNIAFVFVWLSSGGTKSVLHSDLIENLHCVVSGIKTFILIDKKYSEIIGSEYTSQGHYNLDVDAVDMNQYPGLAEVPWYKAVIEPGDCLYLPYEWIHQVTSTGRNMGINVWWIRFSFDEKDCTKVPHAQGFANIGQFRIASEVQIKGFLLDMKREDGTIHATDVLGVQRKRTEAPVTIEQVIQAFEIMKPGCNGLLSEDDLTGISIEKYKEADDFIASILFNELIDQTPVPKNEDNMEDSPFLPIITPGGPPPEELDWEAEIVEEEHPPINGRDEL